mmetsp:Transcript_31770/g.45162  ORF Transcript_31770/g.45162 Transcript_31770/m.45162 type:complete len:477 (-) Transcript_31770:87-1517(-)
MGTYLSTPVTEKGIDEGQALDSSQNSLTWAVVDMQGWRKSMEDSHIAQTKVALSNKNARVFAIFDGHGGPEVARFSALYLVDVLQKDLNRRTESQEENDDSAPSDPAQSGVGLSLISTFHALDRMIDDTSRRDELFLLRNEKPSPGEQRVVSSVPPTQPNLHSLSESQIKKEEASSENPKTGEEAEECSTKNSTDSTIGQDEIKNAETNKTTEDATTKTETKNAPNVGEQDQSESSGGETEEDQKSDLSDSTYEDNDEDRPNTLPPAQTQTVPITASVIHNGRQMCNLPDHPIHAGCTAVVAVLVERTLTVANAGDSRAVLCRAGGRAEALSFDHKPQQEREMNRITKAGGFVNQFGRVNGNLNLSRSIGDLKYKQVPGLTPAEQMITAEPDIVQVNLHPEDEFIILGCDGIWDCLSNDQAVKYVRDRIDSKTPTEIGIEMLDEIISDDPRATQGIGGDNMTVMVVDLLPQKRSYS